MTGEVEYRQLLPRVTGRFSEGPFFRKFIAPKDHCFEKKVYCAEGLLVRRVIQPKKGYIAPKILCSEASLFRNRGSLFRRFIVQK